MTGLTIGGLSPKTTTRFRAEKKMLRGKIAGNPFEKRDLQDFRDCRQCGFYSERGGRCTIPADQPAPCGRPWDRPTVADTSGPVLG